MNSYINITVRVLTRQATAMLSAFDAQLKLTGRSAASAGAMAATSRWDAATKSILKFGQGLQWSGYQLSRTFTVPLLAAGAAAMKYELANEKAFAGIKKVYGDTALRAKIGTKGMMQELRALRQELIALSDTYGQSQTDVENIAESWAAAGVSGKALGTAVEETLKTMVIGDLNAVQSTKALIQIQAQYGANTQGLVRIMNALNTTENITGATMGDLIQGFQRSAGVAAEAGVDYKHLAAFIAALVPAAGSATQAGNSLKTIFTDILAPTSKAAAALDAMGIDVSDVGWLSLNASQRMEVLAQKFMKLDGNQKVVASNYVFGKYQIARFGQAMADISKSFDKNGKYVGDNSKALGYYGKTLVATEKNTNNAKIAQQELQTVLSSNPQKLKQMWTILKNEAGSAMAQMVPFVIQLVTMFASLMHWFGSLSPVTQKWIGIMLIGLALLGPFLLYLSAIIKLGGMIAKVFSGLGKIFSGLWKLISRSAGAVAATEVSEAEAAQEEIYRIYSVKTGRVLKLTEEELNAYQAAQTKRMQSAIASSQTITTRRAAEAAQIAEIATAQADAEIAASERVAATQASVYRASGAAIIQDAVAVASANVQAIETSEAAWGSYAAVANEVLASVAETAGASATAVTSVFVASAEGIELAWVKTGVVIDRVMQMQILNATAAAAAEVAAETAVADSLIAVIALMRETMGSRLLLGRTWVAAGLLEASSIDFVTAQLIIQLRVLQEMLAYYAGIAQVMLTTGETAGTVALVETAGIERVNDQLAIQMAALAALNAEYVRVGETALASGEAQAAGSEIANAPKEVESIFKYGKMAAIILAVVAVFLIFRHQITAVSLAVWHAIESMGRGIKTAFEDVWQFLVQVVRGIIDAFEALPRALVAIFQSVVSIVQKAAHGVYELFSYLNPFAHHSPSLVDNTTDGMQHVRNQHEKTAAHATKHANKISDAHAQMTRSMSIHNSQVSQMVSNPNQPPRSVGGGGAISQGGITGQVGQNASSVDSAVKKALGDVAAFDKAIAGLVKREEDLQRAADIKLLSKYAPGAINEYKTLSNEIDTLTKRYNALGNEITKQQAIVDSEQKTVDNANAALTRQQNILTRLESVQSRYDKQLQHSKDMVDKFANAGIKGMQKYDDAIFKNQEAQNKLQLKMLKMEDAVGSIDDARNAVSNLTAEMAGLQSIEVGLRAKGAGSDVTAVYDKQIAKAQDQIDINQNNIDSYQKLQDALDKLQRTGQELDLEKSLKFDVLERQIEKLTNTTKTLTFKEIIDGITKWKAREKENQSNVNDANKAVTNQEKVVRSAQRIVDNYQKTLDKSNKRLSNMQDRYSKLGDVIQKAKDEISSMTDAADSVANALDKAGNSAKKAGGDIGSVLGPGAGLKGAGGKGVLGRIGGLGNQAKDIKAQTKKLLDGLKDQLGHVDIFAPIKQMFNSIGAWIKKWIWDEPAKWGDWIVKNTEKLGKLLWHWIVEGVSNIAHWISQGWNKVVGFFKALPGHILDLIKDFPHLLVEGGKKLIYGLGYGIGYAAGTITKLVLGIPYRIFQIFKKAGTWLRNAGIAILKGLWHGIEIANDAVMKFFRELPGNILAFLRAAPGWLLNVGEDILKGLWKGISTGAVAVFDFLKAMPGRVKGFFESAPTWLLNIGKHIISGLWNGIKKGWDILWQGFKNFFTGLINGVKKALGIHSPSTVFLEIGKDIIKGLWNGIKAIWATVWGWIKGLGKLVLKGIGELGKLLYGKGKDLFKGLWDGIKNIWENISSWFKGLGGRVSAFFGRAASWLVNEGANIIHGLGSGVRNAWDNIVSWFGDMKDKIVGWFSNAGTWLVGAGKSIAHGLMEGLSWVFDHTLKPLFNGVLDVVGNAVNFGIHVINGLIHGVNAVIRFLHIGSTISTIGTIDIPQLARGGKVPLTGVIDGFVTNGPRAIVGEGNQAYPEYVIPTDPRFRKRAAGLWGALGKDIQMLATGGIIPPNADLGPADPGASHAAMVNNIYSKYGKPWSDSAANTDAVNGIKYMMDDLSGISNPITAIGDALEHVIRYAALAIFTPFKNVADLALDTIDIPFLSNMGKSLLEKIYNWVKGEGDKQSNLPQQIQKWYGLAYRATDMLGMPKEADAGILSAISAISGGAQGYLQTSAKNKGDIANLSHLGLLGMTPSLFGQMEGNTSRIWQPQENIYAAAKYMKSEGTTSGWGPPGLARGGMTTGQLLAMVGDNSGGHELIVPMESPRTVTLLAASMSRALSSDRTQAAISRAFARADADRSNATTLTGTTHVDHSKHATINFYGDLEFPNVKDGSDVKEFVEGLESWASGAV